MLEVSNNCVPISWSLLWIINEINHIFNKDKRNNQTAFTSLKWPWANISQTFCKWLSKTLKIFSVTLEQVKGSTQRLSISHQSLFNVPFAWYGTLFNELLKFKIYLLDTQISDITRWCKHFLLSGVTLSKSTTLASEYPVLEMQGTTHLENQTVYIKARVTNEKTSELTSRSWNATTSIQDLTINDWWCFGGLQGNENLEQLLNFIILENVQT